MNAAAPPARPAVPPAAFLLLGGVLVCFTFMRLSLPELAWVVFAPFLVLLHSAGTARRHLAVFTTLVLAFLAAVGKMATSEIPWVPVPMFALPIAASYFLALTLAGAAHRRLGARWGVYAFAAATVVLGWVQYTWTPGASWGVLAHTQLDNLPLVQLVALTGVGGVTFLVALGSGLAAAAWTSGVRAVRGDLLGFGIVLLVALLHGQYRLWESVPARTLRVGGVVSPVTHAEFRQAFVSLDTLRRFDDELFARSARAVELGARIVVWNEMATLVSAAGESTLAARGRAFAREHGVLLLMAYGVVTSMHPFHDRNQYRIYLPDGTLADDYAKRHPVPGDPDDVGTAHARVVPFEGAKPSGAICYDFSFPGIARDLALDGAGLALVPASDWRGIDPQHARMALMNAVAVGLPMVRPVRAATSIATDPRGRLLGAMPAGDPSGVLVVAVPSERAATLYTRTGELVPLLAFAHLVLVLAMLLRRRRGG